MRKLSAYKLGAGSQGDREGRPIGINLSRQIRQEAGRSVGARVDDVGLGGPLWSPAGWGGGRVSPRGESGEQDAGDHKGPPFRSPPLSPLRMLMGLLLVDAYWATAKVRP